MSDMLLQVQNLKKHFPVRGTGFGPKKVNYAVDGVSLEIKKGETLGLVGESGCGKSTLGRTILRLYNPTDGKIIYDDVDITTADMLPYRKRMQIIFQDPYSSLDPRMTVGDIVGEPLDILKANGDDKAYASQKERQQRIVEQLRLVGLNTEHMNRYPHEFSGGQRQRISIARALTIQPEFVVCDEPISALDVSIQAQVINMLIELQKTLSLTYLFIAHDLSVVKYISDRVGVMYLGKMVELASSHDLYKTPLHPYTQALLSAIPIPDPKLNRGNQRILLEGDVPNPIDPPSGCRFRTRCPYAREVCAEKEPVLFEAETGHQVACHKVSQGW